MCALQSNIINYNHNQLQSNISNIAGAISTLTFKHFFWNFAGILAYSQQKTHQKQLKPLQQPIQHLTTPIQAL
jgi:hypothetical protein